MFSVLFSVLKIIGIVVFIILMMLILIITLVLFAPIRYCLSIKKDEEEQHKPISAIVKVKWLGGIVSFKALYPQKPYFTFRILGFRLFNKKTPGKKQKNAKQAKNDNEKHSIVSANKATCNSSKINDNDSEKEKSDDLIDNSTLQLEKNVNNVYNEDTENIDTENIDKTNDTVEKSNIILKIRNAVKRIILFMKKIYIFLTDRAQSAVEKKNKIADKINWIHSLLQNTSVQNSVVFVKDEFIKILKAIGPNKIKGSVVIGFDDPYTTGQVLAISGMLYPVFGEHIHIVGDFEHNICEIDLYMKGKIRLIKLICVALRLYFNKELKKALAYLRRK